MADQIISDPASANDPVVAEPFHDNLHEQIIGLLPAAPHARLGQVESFPVQKLEAHLKDIHHVAVSVFVFSEDRLLLQQRAQSKYHSSGLWANTVCSHPRWSESAQLCASRRLEEELGWGTALYQAGVIDYRAQVGELFENEHVHCFYGALKPPAASRQIDLAKLLNLCDPFEVADLAWMTLAEIDRAVQSTPEKFSAWFKIYLSQHRDKLQKMLELAAEL